MNRSLLPSRLWHGIGITLLISVAGFMAVAAVTRHTFSLRALRTFDPGFLVLGVAAIASAWVVKAWRTRSLLWALGYGIPTRRLLQIYLAAAFASHITPGNSGGVPTHIYLVHKQGVRLGRSVALTAMDSALNLVVGLAALAVFVASRRVLLPASGHRVELAVVAALALLLLAVGIFLCLMWRPRWMARLLRSAVGGIWKSPRGLKFGRRLGREALSLGLGLRVILARGWLMALVVLQTMAYWALYLAVAPLLILSLGLPVPWEQVIAAQVIFNFAQIFFPTPGGSGGAELGMAYLFRGMVPSEDLGLFVLGWRFITFYLSLALGGWFFVDLFHRASEGAA